MSQKISTRQSRQYTVLPMVGNSVNEQLDSVLLKVDAQLSKLFEDRNVQLSGGGLISNNSAGDSVTFSSALTLTVNSKVAGGTPVTIDLTSTTRAFTVDGNMLYAVIDRGAGTATITADSATLPAVTAANQEVYLIAKRVGNAVYFMNGMAIAANTTLAFDRLPFYQPDVVNEAAATGANALLPAYTAGVIRLTSATITSLGGMTARQSGVFVVLTNSSGVNITVNNEDTVVAAANRFLTGTDSNITLRPNSSFIFIYDGTAQRWMLAGGSGSGSGGGGGSLDTLFVQTFEEAAIGDFTQTGLIIDTTTADLINGDKTAKLIHDSVTIQDFKQIIDLPNKYQSDTDFMRNLSISLYARSNASDGNVTLDIHDETNNTPISSEVISTIDAINANENLFSFDVPLTCEQISYKVSGLAEVGSPETFVDDISIFLTPSELTQSLLFQEQDSTVELGVGNGFGSTATVIRRFSSIRQQLGSGVSYTDSATLGASFTILEDGIYDIAYTETSTSGTPVTFITKNQAVLTAQPANIEILAATTISTPTGSQTCSVSLYLVAGDIIRAVCNSVGLINSTSANARFSITKQGQLKQVNTNPDSKIAIPTSELRFEGASSRGATATAIVRFDAVAKLRGDAFTVESDATLGTRITMRKAGKLDVGFTLSSGAGYLASVTRNQTNLTTTPPAAESLSSDSTTTGAGTLSASTSVFVNVGDIIRVYASANPTANANNNLNLSFQEQDISVSVTNIQPKFSDADSNIRVDGSNGFGSTNTVIRRFSNIRNVEGSDIEYADSATLGSSFTIKEGGIFEISYTDNANAPSDIGISLNSNQLTTVIVNIDTEDRLAVSSIYTASARANASWTGSLIAGDVIRPHTNGTPAGSTPNNTHFSITKVGKPNITAVDVTPFVVIPQPVQQTIEALTVTNTFGATNTGVPVLNITRNTNTGILSVSSSAALGTSFTALKACQVNVAASWFAANANATVLYVTRNATLLTSGSSDGIIAAHVAPDTNSITHIAAPVQLEAGDILRVQRISGVTVNINQLVITAEALSDQIVTELEMFSSDTAALTYVGSATYTPATLQNAPIGTFITYTYGANSNVKTQTNAAAPTQTVSDMNTNGILLTIKAYNQASTAAAPCAVDVQIGKGFKGRLVEMYKAALKTTSGDFSRWGLGIGKYGCDVSYNEKTGILSFDAGYDPSATSTIGNGAFLFADATASATAYFVINGSKNPALAGLNVLDTPTVFHGQLGANQALTANVTNITVTTPDADTKSAYASGIYTVKNPGHFACNLNLLTTGGAASVAVWINGASRRTFMTANTSWNSGYIIVPNLRFGDQISFRVDSGVTLSGASSVSISKVN